MSSVNASFEKLHDYEQRSLAFEPGRIDGQHQSGEWAGVIFRIGKAHLACSIEQVHEFLPIPAYTPVPGTKPWILGLANVRGDLLTVVDLAWFLNGERSAISMRTRLLAASLRGRPVGLLVDEVFGQRRFVSDEGKEATLPGDSPLKEFIHKQYRSGKDVWQELDLDSLFTTPEFLNGAAA
ncbi:MAG: chemotaxis protein CheW [Gammaproteobacteria bacterium]|nr:chemotaxis protein CheW [Gammaproteobacteria bacterium]NNL00195.1 purine-binding chemotaxis protein CheW [Xanthomonadales bacterium]